MNDRDFDDLLLAEADEPRGTPAETGSWLQARWQRFMAIEGRQRDWQWGVPILVTVTAAVTRLWGLGYPSKIVFDETYYVKDAWSLWNLGYSASWRDGADEGFARGVVDTFTTDGSFVVHPPLGKWLIGAGMALLGPENATSWRIATAVAGILAVLLLFFIARKLFTSTLLGGIAAGLLAIDGNAIVMSRVALLDNFVMLFALAGFGAMLLDRGWSERRLERWMSLRRSAGGSIDWGPVFWWRPWLFTAALAFGLTSAVKWSGLYFLAAFAVYSLVVDALARRRAGVPFWLSGTLLRQGPASLLLTVPIAAVVYVLSWVSWFTSNGGYDRHWAELPERAATGFFAWVPLEVQSWWHYHLSIYNFHVAESSLHSYQANPLTWLFLVRPTSMYYEGSIPCGASVCGASISGIANPLIWWAGTAALFYLVYRLLRFREWQVGLILMGMVAGYLPWLLYLNRTVFQFYTIAFEPYLILALTFAIAVLLGKRGDPSWQREKGIRLVVVFLVLAVAISIFFWPLWTGVPVDQVFLRAHWWLYSWI